MRAPRVDRWRRVARWTLVLVSALVVGPCARALASTEAVAYLERPVGGKLVAQGRPLPPTVGDSSYGIDIFSTVEIRIDEDALRAALLELVGGDRTEVATLLERVELLSKATETVRAATEAAETAFRTGDWERSRAAIQHMGRSVGELLRALTDAMRLRLAEQGRVDAAVAVDRAFDRILIDTYPGFDFEVLAELFSRELDALYDDLEALDPGLSIEIQAHLIDRRGHAFAVFLPNYNTVETGPLKPVTKLRFEMSDDEREVYRIYAQLTRDLGSARNVSQAVLSQLRAEFELLRPELQELAADVERAWANARTRVRSVLEWDTPGRWRQWARDVAAELENSSAGQAYLAMLDALAEIEEDFEALRLYGRLDEKLTGRTADEALDAVLALFSRDGAVVGVRALRAETWRRRGEVIDTFAQAVRGLPRPLKERIVEDPNGPWAALTGLRDALGELVAEVRGFTPRAVDWVRNVLGIPLIRVVADLPVPPGQQRLPLTAEADTRFDLRTIMRETREGDHVRVQFRFFSGGNEIERAGFADRFYLREFGWSSNVLASLAFTRQAKGSDRDWEPAPAASWIAHYRPWPDADVPGDRGLSGLRKLGFGLTTLTLDFEDEADIEVGLGASVSLLDDRIMLGYGTNLQADEAAEFWFFSIRMLRLARVP